MIFGRLTRFFRGNRLAVAGLCVTVLIVLLALAAPLFVSYDDAVKVNTLERFQPPSREHPFGTTALGHDVLHQMLWGARTSLTVGLLGVLLAAAIGTTTGLIAGYKGEWVDSVFIFVVDIMKAFPMLLLALVMVAMLGASLTNIIVAIGIAWSPGHARLVRGLVLQLRTQEYVEAARSIGASTFRILWRHVLRNALGPILVLMTLGVASAIIVEASLSYLGLGPPPPTPTWGRLIADGQPYLRDAAWISIFPGLAILVTVLALNVFGDGLRDSLDPRALTVNSRRDEA